MPIDILDQPRGGILETVLYLLNNKKRYPLDQLVSRMTATEDGRKFFERNVIDLLEAMDFIAIDDDVIVLQECPVINRWQGSDSELDRFEMYFKLEFLSKVIRSIRGNVRYFGEVLRKLFDEPEFDKAVLEGFLREARRQNGLEVSDEEALRGKIDFCINLLKYLGFITQTQGLYCVYLPREILTQVFFLALEDINKTSIRLYSELLEYIDKVYLPVVNRSENRVLKVVYNAMNITGFIASFNFANVPDGGRTVTLLNKEFNAVLKR